MQQFNMVLKVMSFWNDLIDFEEVFNFYALLQSDRRAGRGIDHWGLTFVRRALRPEPGKKSKVFLDI